MWALNLLPACEPGIRVTARKICRGWTFTTATIHELTGHRNNHVKNFLSGIMPICIECCYPVSQLYHVLHSRNHKATAPPVSNSTYERSTANIAIPHKPSHSVPKVPERKTTGTNTGGGGDVRLTQCPRCKRFADKYVEHDFVVLFIDLVLVKPQVS